MALRSRPESFLADTPEDVEAIPLYPGVRVYVVSTREFLIHDGNNWEPAVDCSEFITREEALEMFVRKGKP